MQKGPQAFQRAAKLQWIRAADPDLPADCMHFADVL